MWGYGHEGLSNRLIQEEYSLELGVGPTKIIDKYHTERF